MIKSIEISLGGKSINAEVEFDYIPALAARLNADPIDCYPEENEEFIWHELMLENDNGDFVVDMTELIDYIEDEIILAIKAD